MSSLEITEIEKILALARAENDEFHRKQLDLLNHQEYEEESEKLEVELDKLNEELKERME